MANENRISLILEGTQRDGGHVRFDVFLQELQRLQSMLGTLDAAAANGQRNSHFAVVGLSHSSPASVELEARPNRGRIDVSSAIFHLFHRVYEGIEANNIPDDADIKLLEGLKGLASPVGSGLDSAILKINGATFNLTESIAHRIELHLSNYEECLGYIEGMLERINVHADANVFTIYPDVGPKSLACHFPPALQDKAIASVKKKVAVTGLMRYRKHSPFAHHVDVSDIDIFPDADQLASFQDLYGIAPDATGALSSEEFVKEFRCGWQ